MIRRHLQRLAAVLLSSVALALTVAPAASAHATLIASDPAENAALTQSPTQVSATFNEPMQAQFAAMTVVGPDGQLWSTGEPQVHDTVISIAVRPLGPAGVYTANYRATSADGHVVSGSWPFQFTPPSAAGVGTSVPTPAPETVPAPSTPSSQTAPTPAGSADAVPLWPFWIAAIVAVGAAAWWAVRRRT